MSIVSVFIVGHITKEGAVAGPKVLEHMADVVLQLQKGKEPICSEYFRMKNRFGS
ncbi:MAG: hypothetical protein IPG99_02560 [Ignavibacteria bacterium]|nr:hypothetical protein [Ignavibacteria bacterium]